MDQYFTFHERMQSVTSAKTFAAQDAALAKAESFVATLPSPSFASQVSHLRWVVHVEPGLPAAPRSHSALETTL